MLLLPAFAEPIKARFDAAWTSATDSPLQQAILEPMDVARTVEQRFWDDVLQVVAARDVDPPLHVDYSQNIVCQRGVLEHSSDTENTSVNVPFS